MKLKPNITTESKTWCFYNPEKQQGGISIHADVYIELKSHGKVELVFKITCRGTHYDSRENGKTTDRQTVVRELQRMLGVTEGTVTYQRAISALNRV